MALLCVQSKKISAVATTVTVNSAWTPTTGNLIVTGISAFDNSGIARSTNHIVSDNLNSTYTRDRTDGGTSAVQTSIHHKGNITGGLSNLTANGGTQTDVVVGMFHEVSGANTTAPFTSGETTGNTYTATTNPQTATVTNATANSIFFAVMGNFDGSATSTLTVNSTGSSPTGWALKNTTNSQEIDGNNSTTASMPFLIVSSSAATKHGWTTGNFAGTYSIACFIQATAAAATLPRPLLVDQAINRAATY